MREAVISGKPFYDLAVKAKLTAIPYPRFYIDFETVRFTVPIWLGTSPFQQLPFQWSCHIEHADGQLEHLEFLESSGEAPMRAFTESLIATLGNTGPILVYNAGFEKTRLSEMAIRYPEHAESLRDKLATQAEGLLETVRQMDEC